MIVLIGKTCSGKDTILNRLTENYGYKKIITYTTRPMRKNEKQDITYHFISEEDFINKINDNFFAEYKKYNTKHGRWYYGTALEDLEKSDDKSIIILTPDGYKDIVKKLPDKPKSIYIYANNSTIRKRLIARGDDRIEMQRRIEHDNADFKGVENDVDKIIYNNFGCEINEIVEKILSFLGENK